MFVALCVVLIASPFVTVGRSGVHLGPIFSQQTARRDDMDFVERIILRANGLHQRAVVVVGAWLPKILGVLLDQPPGNVEYLYALTASDLQRHLAESAVYYTARHTRIQSRSDRARPCGLPGSSAAPVTDGSDQLTLPSTVSVISTGSPPA